MDLRQKLFSGIKSDRTTIDLDQNPAFAHYMRNLGAAMGPAGLKKDVLARFGVEITDSQAEKYLTTYRVAVEIQTDNTRPASPETANDLQELLNSSLERARTAHSMYRHQAAELQDQIERYPHAVPPAKTVEALSKLANIADASTRTVLMLLKDNGELINTKISQQIDGQAPVRLDDNGYVLVNLASKPVQKATILPAKVEGLELELL